MNFRAQGTLEYLVIIAVVVVVALVVVAMLMNQTSSVGETSNKVSKLGSVSGQFAVKEIVVGADGNAIIVLQNNSGGVVSVESIGIGRAVRGTGGTQLSSTGEQTFALENISSGCDCSSSIGQKKTCDINISYTSAEGLTKTISLSVPVECESSVTPARTTLSAGECLTNSDCTSGQTCVMGANTTLNKCYSSVVGYWRFEGNANDSSPSGNNGTPSGGTAYLTGKIGQDMNFDGSSGYVDVGDDSSLNPDNNFTISMWIKTSVNSGGALYSKRYSSWGGYQLDMSNGGILVMYGDDTQGPATGNWTVSLLDNTWHNIVVTIVPLNYVNLHVDGIDLGSQDISSILGSAGSSQHSTIGGGAVARGNFSGVIDEVTIFNRALSTSEVGALYTAQVGN